MFAGKAMTLPQIRCSTQGRLETLDLAIEVFCQRQTIYLIWHGRKQGRKGFITLAPGLVFRGRLEDGDDL